MRASVVRSCVTSLFVLAALLANERLASGGIASRVVRETVEQVLKKSGKTAIKEGAGAFAARLERLAAKYGDECLEAARKLGPRGVDAIEQAGVLGRTAAKVLARHGDKALKLAGSPRALRLAAEFGDDAARAIIRHAGIAEELIEKHGTFAAGAQQAERPAGPPPCHDAAIGRAAQARPHQRTAENHRTLRRPGHELHLAKQERTGGGHRAGHLPERSGALHQRGQETGRGGHGAQHAACREADRRTRCGHRRGTVAG